jgi:hypothetical protein
LITAAYMEPKVRDCFSRRGNRANDLNPIRARPGVANEPFEDRMLATCTQSAVRALCARYRSALAHGSYIAHRVEV